MRGLPFECAPVCSWSIELDHYVPIGDTPEGLRGVGYLKEGIVSGPRINGTAMAGSADWAIMRRDGVLRPDVKLIIKTDDGATILLTYDGFVDLGPDGFDKRANGEPLGVLHPRMLVRMLTESPAYAWVNRSPFIGIGILEYRDGKGIISYDIYQITAPGPGQPG